MNECGLAPMQPVMFWCDANIHFDGRRSHRLPFRLLRFKGEILEPLLCCMKLAASVEESEVPTRPDLLLGFTSSEFRASWNPMFWAHLALTLGPITKWVCGRVNTETDSLSWYSELGQWVGHSWSITPAPTPCLRLRPMRDCEIPSELVSCDFCIGS